MQNFSVLDFNYHLKHAKNKTRSFDLLYEYCLSIIKKHIVYRFGLKNFDSFLSNVPHDVFTRVILEYPPKGFIASPSGYLCKAASNFVISLYSSEDNKTVELDENYHYMPEYEDEFEFESEEIERAWNSLDEKSRYILYMNEYLDYRLTEIADIMGERSDYVRTKKSRALKALRNAAVKIKPKNKMKEVYQ